MDDTYNLNINQADMNLLSEALGNMPFKAIAPLVAKINNQIGVQMTAKAKASLPPTFPVNEDKPHANGAQPQA